MPARDILNASVEAVMGNLSENSSNIHDVFIEHNERADGLNAFYFVGLGLLCFYSVFSLLGYSLAYLELSYYSKRRESWYIISHWLSVSFLCEMYPILTAISHIYNLLYKTGELGFVKHGKRFLLTLHAYAFLTLALYSHNLVFKTFFRCPLSRIQKYIILAGLYIISSFPTIYFLCVYGWADSRSGYLSFTWQFAQYPGPQNMTMLLLYNYIIPAGFATFLLVRVAIELARRGELCVLSSPKTNSLHLEDRNLISTTFSACFAFVFTHIFFLAIEIFRIYTYPSLDHDDGVTYGQPWHSSIRCRSSQLRVDISAAFLNCWDTLVFQVKLINLRGMPPSLRAKVSDKIQAATMGLGEFPVTQRNDGKCARKNYSEWKKDVDICSFGVVAIIRNVKGVMSRLNQEEGKAISRHCINYCTPSHECR
ncbi:uncharacterized protein NPIL_430881 [Nephila pilipes]|uniref:Uncharacterized protein n=1 Tax=Nephila pilipes TaxID=299642 RepID=A0A8X6QRA1_NEPPI|nr:uncharacterized protein NPIL_430881 [Nephila pilipes]